MDPTMAMVHPKEYRFATRLVFPPRLLRITPCTNPHLATLGNVVGCIDDIRGLVEFGQVPEVKVRDPPTVFVHVIANPMWERIFGPSAVDMGPCSGAVSVVARGPVDIESFRLCPLWNWLAHGRVYRTVRLCNLARGGLRRVVSDDWRCRGSGDQGSCFAKIKDEA